jgi:hypothetical protein
MKRTTVLAVLFLSGCSLTPTQRKVLAITGSVLVVGAIAAHDSDHGPKRDVTTPGNPCQMNPKACQ